MTRHNLITATVGAGGWLSTLSLTDAASAFAALATGLWFCAQAYVLLTRQRCKRMECHRRLQ